MDIIDTSFKIKYDFFDTSAKADAQYTTNDNETFADMNLMYEDTFEEYERYMTLEHNFSCLDGGMSEFTQYPDIAFYSDEMSNAQGVFTNAPKIHIAFSRNHSSVGLSLNFANDYPLQVNVIWYDGGGYVLANKLFDIRTNNPTLYYPVENYRSVDVEFVKTLPNRNIKLEFIEYGNRYYFAEDQIIDATMNMELDPISSKLPIDSLKFSIWDADNMFNLGNSEGLHKYIQYSQELDPIELVRGEEVHLGKYYINTYSSTDAKIEFQCTSFLGLLDNMTYYKGDIYENGITAQDLLDAIVDDINVVGMPEFELESDLQNVVLYGSLKPQSYRSALKELCFALSACMYHVYDEETEVETYRITKKTNVSTGSITRQTKISTKTTKKEYVSAVTIKYNTYVLDEDTSEVVSGYYPAGDNLITFNQPYSTLSASAGTITEAGKYYCILHLDSAGDVTISGYAYKTVTNNASVAISLADLNGGNSANEKSFTSQLADYDLGISIANYILEYYKYVIKVDIKHLYDNEAIQETYTVQNPKPGYTSFVGNFEKINLDLTKGFIATSTLSCKYNQNPKYYYADSELILDDDFII